MAIARSATSTVARTRRSSSSRRSTRSLAVRSLSLPGASGQKLFAHRVVVAAQASTHSIPSGATCSTSSSSSRNSRKCRCVPTR